MIYNYEFYRVYLPGRPDNQTVARNHIVHAAAIIMKYNICFCLPFVSYRLMPILRYPFALLPVPVGWIIGPLHACVGSGRQKSKTFRFLWIHSKHSTFHLMQTFILFAKLRQYIPFEIVN